MTTQEELTLLERWANTHPHYPLGLRAFLVAYKDAKDAEAKLAECRIAFLRFSRGEISTRKLGEILRVDDPVVFSQGILASVNEELCFAKFLPKEKS